MANEKPPDNRDTNAFQNKEEKGVYPSCIGRIEHPGAEKTENLTTELYANLKFIDVIKSELVEEVIAPAESLNQLDSENERFHFYVQYIETKLRENGLELDLAVNQVLEINENYGYLAYDIPSKEHPQILELVQENLDKSKELVKIISDIQRYLNYQFNTTQSLFDRTAYPFAYFQRIRKYLEILPRACHSLALLTSQAIANRVPGTESDNFIQGYLTTCLEDSEKN